MYFKGCISCTEGNRKIEINIWWKLEIREFVFLWSIYQNIAIFRHCPKILSKRVQTCISYTNGDRKMRVNSKRKFEMHHYFLNSLSQILTFLTFLKVFSSRSDVINPKMGEKGSNWYFMYQCNVERKIRIKSKRYFQVNYFFMKLLL